MKALLFGLGCIILGIYASNPSNAKFETKNYPPSDDTLNVGYSYWWPFSGPFLFPKKESIALVFYGTVVRIEEPVEDSNLLYTPQTGVIKIEEVYHAKSVERWSYENQSYFKSDCFHGMNLMPGDPVLISCYEYEHSYAIPGVKSVLALNDGDQKILKSAKMYFKGKYKNLLKDTTIWEQYGLKDQFKNAVYGLKSH